MNPRPIQVTVDIDFTLKIKFSNNEIRTYDMKPHLNFGVFKELSDLTYFQQARIENGTISWPNGQDICPDTLYEDSKATLLTA